MGWSSNDQAGGPRGYAKNTGWHYQGMDPSPSQRAFLSELSGMSMNSLPEKANRQILNSHLLTVLTGAQPGVC